MKTLKERNDQPVAKSKLAAKGKRAAAVKHPTADEEREIEARLADLEAKVNYLLQQQGRTTKH
jgi:hypothetical protein